MTETDEKTPLTRTTLAMFVRFVRMNPHLPADDPMMAVAFTTYLYLNLTGEEGDL